MGDNIVLEILESVSGEQKQTKDRKNVPYNIAIEAMQKSYERGVMAGTEGVLSAIRDMFKGGVDK